jgi:hypothetical protein
VQSVVTYDTIIEFANPDLKLFPGMTGYATTPVATVENVVKVPNTALRYKPPMTSEEILAIYKQYGIESGETLQASQVAAVPNPDRHRGRRHKRHFAPRRPIPLLCGSYIPITRSSRSKFLPVSRTTPIRKSQPSPREI